MELPSTGNFINLKGKKTQNIYYMVTVALFGENLHIQYLYKKKEITSVPYIVHKHGNGRR